MERFCSLFFNLMSDRDFRRPRGADTRGKPQGTGGKPLCSAAHSPYPLSFPPRAPLSLPLTPLLFSFRFLDCFFVGSAVEKRAKGSHSAAGEL